MRYLAPTSGAMAAAVLAALPAPAQEVAWTFQAGGPIYGSPALHGDAVYFGSGDGHLYAVGVASGSERWRVRTGGAIHAAPAVAGGVVYAPSRDGRLYAVDAADGSLRWTFRTGGERRHDFWDFYLSDPLVHGDLVVFGSGDGHVYALDRATGEERWRVATQGIVHGAPVADAERIYAGGFDGVLYAIAAADGRLLWKKREGDGWIVATPLVARGLLYYGASDGRRFYAVERGSGKEAWSVPVHTRVFGSAVPMRDRIVFGGFNGKLLAVDRASGEVCWSFQTEASRKYFATVYDADGALNDEMRRMYRSGEGLAAEERILSLGSIAGTPAVHGDRVFFGTTEGLLYALDTPS